MSDPLKLLGKYKSYGYLILRIIIGIIFVAHGYGKLFGTPGIEAWIGMVTGLGFPIPIFTAYLVGFVELLGGISLILGLFTRYAALLLGIVMIVAILKVKLAMGLLNGYELDLSLLAANISLILSGAGALSLDNKISKA